MISSDEERRFLFDLERGSFCMCHELRKAYEGNEKKDYLMGVYYPTAEEVEKIWREVVNSIKWEIKFWEKNERKEVDHYLMMENILQKVFFLEFRGVLQKYVKTE